MNIHPYIEGKWKFIWIFLLLIAILGLIAAILLSGLNLINREKNEFSLERESSELGEEKFSIEVPGGMQKVVSNPLLVSFVKAGGEVRFVSVGVFPRVLENSGSFVDCKEEKKDVVFTVTSSPFTKSIDVCRNLLGIAISDQLKREGYELY